MTALVIVWIFFGLLTANIADSKGRPFWTWLVYGFLCFPLAILYLAVSKPSDETLVSSGEYRKCPFCAEVVKAEAKVCRYCGRELPEVEVHTPDENEMPDNKTNDKTEATLKIIGAIFYTFVIIAIIISMK